MPTPQVGTIIDGHYFKGGDPNNPNSWSKTPAIGAVVDSHIYQGGDPNDQNSWYKINRYDKNKQKPNFPQALELGIGQGLTFNTLDETAGKTAVNRYQLNRQGSALRDLLKGKPKDALNEIGLAYGNSGKSIRDYISNTAVADARSFIDDAKDSQPIPFWTGTIGGAFVPVGAAKLTKLPRAVGLAARTGIGALEGGIQGALYGAGDAVDGNRLNGAGTGAAVGGFLGGAIPAVGKATSAIFNRARNAIPAFRMTPTQKTLQILDDVTGGKFNNVKSEFERLRKNGIQNPTIADVFPKAARKAGSIARGDGGGAARELAANRGTDMLNQVPSAASKMIRKQTNVPQTKAQIEEMLTAAKNRKQSALINPIRNNQYQLTPIQQAVMASPNVRNATASTANILDTLAASQGAPSQDVNVLRGIVRGEPNNNMVSLDAMEQLRRRLGDQVNNAYQSGNKSLGRDLGTVQDALIQPVREAFPAYNQALNVGNIAKSQIEAMDTGAKDIFNAQTPDIVDTLGNMTNREQRGFRQGAANQMVNRLMDDRNNFDLLRRMAAGQDFTNKLGATFGQDAAQGLQEGAQALNQRIAAARAVNPNFGSQTAENLANDGLGISKAGAKEQIRDAVIRWMNEASGLTPEQKLNYIDSVTKSWGDADLDTIISYYKNTYSDAPNMIPDWVKYLIQNQGAQQNMLK